MVCIAQGPESVASKIFENIELCFLWYDTIFTVWHHDLRVRFLECIIVDINDDDVAQKANVQMCVMQLHAGLLCAPILISDCESSIEPDLHSVNHGVCVCVCRLTSGTGGLPHTMSY